MSEELREHCRSVHGMTLPGPEMMPLEGVQDQHLEAHETQWVAHDHNREEDWAFGDSRVEP